MDFSFNTAVARLTHCADEAAFVHRVYYLVINNEANGRNLHDGKYWTYDSVQALSKIFDFWTPRQLERIIRNCVKLGLVETGNFSENPCDRRTWYTVTETVKSIYANGEMDTAKPWNGRTQTVETIPPNGEMYYKEQLKDQLEDQLESAHASAAASASGTGPAPKRKRGQPERQHYGEFGNVLLSADEYGRLCSRWTSDQVRQAVEALSAYMASKGRRYANHYATLLNWLKRDCPQGPSGGRLIEEDWV